jgi:hypothetical protein
VGPVRREGIPSGSYSDASRNEMLIYLFGYSDWVLRFIYHALPEVSKVYFQKSGPGSRNQQCKLRQMRRAGVSTPSEATNRGTGVVQIIIIHLLGLAPARCMAAPDNGPWAGCRGGAARRPPASDG